jgi:hypothetical protein
MDRWRLTAYALFALLVGTNAFWLHGSVDEGISVSHARDSWEEARRGLDQALAIIPEATRTTDPEVVLEAARAANPLDGFEKEEDGYLWIGELGFRLDDDGSLVEVRSNFP